MTRDAAGTPALHRTALLLLILGLAGAPGLAENMDPDDVESQFAWAENVGWINAEPPGEGDPGVHVHDFELTGWMWGENIGWISLSCQNTGSCHLVHYGVVHDGEGRLAGLAWAENVGWINLEPVGAGVRIDPATGEFSGHAWGENIGWIRFAPQGDPVFSMTTAWRCDPPPPVPPGSVHLIVESDGALLANLVWTSLPGATGYDVVFGYLDLLRQSFGDFSVATEGCLAGKHTGNELLFTDLPAPGDAFWFLVRGANCGGRGTYDSGGPMQLNPRDPQINGLPGICP